MGHPLHYAHIALRPMKKSLPTHQRLCGQGAPRDGHGLPAQPRHARATLTVGNGHALRALPADFLGTAAPVLTTVRLSGIALSSTAFVNSRDVQLDAFPANGLALLSQTFPAVSSLEFTASTIVLRMGSPRCRLPSGLCAL